MRWEGSPKVAAHGALATGSGTSSFDLVCPQGSILKISTWASALRMVLPQHPREANSRTSINVFDYKIPRRWKVGYRPGTGDDQEPVPVLTLLVWVTCQGPQT